MSVAKGSKMKQPSAGNEAIELLRAFTRPILSIFGLVSWVMLLANSYDIPEYFTTLVWAMCLWWFGERGYLRLKGKL